MAWSAAKYFLELLLPAMVSLGALLWVSVQVSRSAYDRQLWLVLGCAGAGATEYMLAWLEHGSGSKPVVLLAQNLSMITFQFLLLCFLLYPTSARSWTPIRRQFAVFLVASVLLTVFWATTERPLRGSAYTATFSADFPSPSMRLFQLTGYLYAWYAVLIALRAAWKYARISRRRSSSFGLRIISVALGGKCIGAAGRTFSIVAGWLHYPTSELFNTIAGSVLWISQTGFLVGVVYPSIADRVRATRRWFEHQCAYHRLEPLWTALHNVYPQTMLHQVPRSKMRHLLFWQSMHRRYYRRVIECRDGLVYISPYLPRPSQGANEPVVRTAEQWAVALHAALSAVSNHYPPVGGAMPVASPASPDLDSDAAELVALSRALAHIDESRDQIRPRS
ncbi:MAG: hypothetical protein JO100_03950 [Pseudonocardia sp.]|nr:hypothetical protein [Pseudonocardia sp.]